MLTDVNYDGVAHKAIVSASRNGWFYAIDRVSGKLIYAEKFASATSVKGVENGKMITEAAMRPTVDKEVMTCPSFLGGKNWWPIAVDTPNHLAFVPTMHTCMTIKGAAVSYKAGLPFLGETFKVIRDPAFPDSWGAVQAIDTNTGKQVWNFKSELPWNDGMLATACGLVFSGSADGHLYAFDSKTGAVAWKSPQLASGIIGVPSTWKVGDKQYRRFLGRLGRRHPDLGRRHGEGPEGQNHPARWPFLRVLTLRNTPMQTRKVLANRACLAVLGAAFGVVLTHGAAKANDLSVCVDKSSPTLAADQKLAEAVAGAEHARLVTYQFDGSGDGDDGFDVKDFSKLLASHCDIVLGYPDEAAGAAAPPGLKESKPYGSTGFVLVVAGGVVAHSLNELPTGTEVAVTYGTAPNLFLLSHPKLKADLHPTEAETIHTLVSGEVTAAMVWHPTVARTAGTAGFAVHALDDPHASWNLVALTTPAKADLARAFDNSVASLARSGDLAKIMAPYGIDVPQALGGAVFSHTENVPTTGEQAFDPAFVRKAAFSDNGDAQLPALYTTAQAKDGEQKFAENCAQCHGDNLEGMAGPALKGPNFASEKAAFKVGDIFKIVSENMPATQPGSLEHGDYVQIMAFLLQQNGFPAGSTELQFDATKTSTVPFLYHGK